MKENQDGYDSRFLDTHASIESIRNVTLEDITNFKTYINKDFNKISENCKDIAELWNSWIDEGSNEENRIKIKERQLKF